MPQLEVITGPDAGKHFSVGGLVLLGRSSDNAIFLTDPRASRRHALILPRGDDFVLEDLHSTNGTFLRGQRLPPRQQYALQSGDIIQAGDTQMMFTLDAVLQEVMPAYSVPRQGWLRTPFFQIVTTHSWVFLCLMLLMAACFIPFAPSVKTAQNVDDMTMHGDPDTQFYNHFKTVFHNDEFFIIAFEKENIFTKENLLVMKSITNALSNIEEAREVKSLTNIDDAVGGKDTFTVKRFLEKIPDKPQELEKLKQQAIKNPLYVNSFISRDARTASIVVFAYDRPNDPQYRKTLLSKTQQVLDPYRHQGHRFYLGGWTTTNLSLSQYLERDMAIFIPIAYLAIAFTVWVVSQNLWLTLLAVVNISVCLGSTMGVFGLAGITMNPVTSIAPPLVMALALSETIHIFSHLDKRLLDQFPDKRQVLAHVLHEAFLPCLLTVVTSLIGFAALGISDIPAIKQFSFIAIVGTLFEFCYAFLLMPPLMLFFRPETLYRDYDTQQQDRFTIILQYIHAIVSRHNKGIVAIVSLLVLLSGWLMTRLQVDTNLIEYFKKSSTVRMDIDFIEKHLSGVDSLDISFQASEDEAFKDPANLKVLDKIQQFVKTLPGVDVTTSLVDFVKDMHQSFHNENPKFYGIPDSKNLVTQYLLLYSSDDLDDFVNDRYNHARLAVRLSEHSSAKQGLLIEKTQDYIKTIQPPHLQIRITGKVFQDTRTIRNLVQGQISGLELAVIGISIVMALVAFRSLSIGLLSLIPNICPLILNFGIMGAFGIPLNTATALISTVALGLAVDNTIHFLSEYKSKRAHNIPIAQAVEDLIFSKGRAVLSSSFILCIGFGVMMGASFVPTINFGMLCTIIMLIDVILDVFFLPALLLLKK